VLAKIDLEVSGFSVAPATQNGIAVESVIAPLTVRFAMMD
jgi:hypothetical protein